MDAGDRQVEGRLLVGLQAEVGQVVGIGVDAVPELILAPDRLDQHRHALVAQQPLVPLERLAPGVVGVGVARHAVGDLAQAERAARVEQHQQQVGHPFESVEALHRGQSRSPGVRLRR